MPGLSGNAEHGQLGFVAIEGDAGNDRCSMFLSSSTVIRVPSPSSWKLESTRSLTFVLAGEFDRRICSTLEPGLAISSISSKVMVSSFLASGTTRGSVV